MNSSTLLLLGAYDALIALIQSEREVLCRSFDPDGAIQTLKKIKSEFVNQLLESARAQIHAGETFAVTLDQLLAGLPQGSDGEAIARQLQFTVTNLLPQGPTPPWPSRSSSKGPFGFSGPEDLSQLIGALQRIADQKPLA